MPDYFGDNMRKQRNSGDEKEEEIKGTSWIGRTNLFHVPIYPVVKKPDLYFPKEVFQILYSISN